jgi:hypothetical protein
VNSYLTAGSRGADRAERPDLIAGRRQEPPSAARRGSSARRSGRPRRARHVFATRVDPGRLARRFPTASEKASVVPLAAFDREPAEVRSRYGLDGPFVLSTGTLEPRKNLLRLIEALPDGALLVVVGPRGWEDDRIVQHADDRVRFLGEVSDEELAGLYRLCTVFCYPSLYEGFGLPVLEALKAGAPVVTSNVSSLPEVAGDAARYVDPGHGADREALRAPDAGRRERLRERGRAQAARFSWDRAAERSWLNWSRSIVMAAARRSPQRLPVALWVLHPRRRLARRSSTRASRSQSPGEKYSAESPATSGIAPHVLATMGSPAAIPSASTIPNCSSQKHRGGSPGNRLQPALETLARTRQEASA